MFEALLSQFVDLMITAYERKQKALAWTQTQTCRNCHKNIPVSHRVCGFCGVPVQLPPSLSPMQEQVAEMETVQVRIVPHIRVDREKHPMLYQYLATKRDTGKTEPIQLSAHQTKHLMQRLEI